MKTLAILNGVAVYSDRILIKGLFEATTILHDEVHASV